MISQNFNVKSKKMLAGKGIFLKAIPSLHTEKYRNNKTRFFYEIFFGANYLF